MEDFSKQSQSIGKPQPEKQERPNRARTLQGLVGLVALLTALALALLIPRYLHKPIERVYLKGNQRIDQKSILQHLGLTEGDDWMNLDPFVLSYRINQMPWVKQAVVQKKPDQSLLVTLVEQEPIAYLNLKGKMMILSEELTALPHLPGLTGDLPVITDESLAPEPGDRLAQASIHTARRLMALLEASRVLPLDQVSELIVSDPLNLKVVTKQRGIVIHFGGKDFAEKLERLARAMPTLNNYRSSIHYIDLRNFQGVAFD